MRENSGLVWCMGLMKKRKREVVAARIRVSTLERVYILFGAFFDDGVVNA